jgi:hypothetical protein
LEGIGEQNWECAHRLLQCVAAASRPLRVEELAEFLAFDFDLETRSAPTFLADWRPEDPENTVLSTCSSLLAVVNVAGSPVIQFAHFSVKEYLTSARLAKAKDIISRFHIPMTMAHSVVAQACLGVLLHFDKGVNLWKLRDFPLSEYAAEHWIDHARFENVSSHVQDGMRRLFDPRNHHFSVWDWIRDSYVSPYSRPTPSVAPETARSTPLHYADPLPFDLHDIAPFLVDELSQDINALDRNKRETLPLAAWGEGDAYARSTPYVAPETARSTPLHYAASFGLRDIAAFLIDEHLQDINALDRIREETPLHAASREGHAVVAQLLIDNGADVMAKAEHKRTPLHLASMYGRVEVARVLLKHGAEVDTRDWYVDDPGPVCVKQTASPVIVESTPLGLALNAGNGDVALVLLEHGANRDINPRVKRSGRIAFR